MTRNGRIEKGQGLGGAISARAWNRAQDAADRVLGSQGGVNGQGVIGPPLMSLEVFVRNDTTGGVAAWSVLAITGVVSSPTGTTGPSVATFTGKPSVIGVVPATGSSVGYVVTTEPIPQGKLGRAAIAGVVQAKLDVSDASHTWCTPKGGSVSAFVSGVTGDAQVLWKEPGTGSGKWALIRIGGGSQPMARLGKVTGTWAKGATASVTQWLGDGSAAVTGPSGPLTFAAINRAQTVTGPTGGYWVGCVSIDGTWHLEWSECSA